MDVGTFIVVAILAFIIPFTLSFLVSRIITNFMIRRGSDK